MWYNYRGQVNRRKSSHHAVGQLYDIQQVLQHYSDVISWERLASDAIEMGLTGPLFIGLAATDAVLGAEIPEAVWADILPRNYSPEQFARFLALRVLRLDPWDRWDNSMVRRTSRSPKAPSGIRRYVRVRPDWYLRLRKRLHKVRNWDSDDLVVEDWTKAVIDDSVRSRLS